MKVLQVIFSTNRIPYLTKTLEAQTKFNFEGLEVFKLLIDDYPKDRNNNQILELASQYNFDGVTLHTENLGLTETWGELFEAIKTSDFDYILHHEDDVVLLHEVKVMDLIKVLESNPNLSQVQLKRNNWFPHEIEEPGPKDTDTIFENYRYETNCQYFWSLMSLYPAWVAKEPIKEETGSNPAEYVLGEYMRTKYNKCSALLKTSEGGIMVEHIGEYWQGKRVAEGEPGWDMFKGFDPNLKYVSKTGQLWKE